MPNLLEHRFAIKRITKPSNEDYISGKHSIFRLDTHVP